MGKNSAPLVADLYLFGFERDFKTSLSGDNQADIIEALDISTIFLILTIVISKEWSK